MMFERAHSIVVVHGISGPKTWVRFPVCSVFYILFSSSNNGRNRKSKRNYGIEKSLIIDDVDNKLQNILFPCIFGNPSIQFNLFYKLLELLSLSQELVPLLHYVLDPFPCYFQLIRQISFLHFGGKAFHHHQEMMNEFCYFLRFLNDLILNFVS